MVASLLLVAGAVFGCLLAFVKGSGGGVRYDLGNVAAAWLILPTVAGARAPRSTLAAAWSGSTSLLALVAFYVTGDRFTFGAWQHVLRNRLFFLIVGSIAAGVFAVLVYVVTRWRARLRLVPLAAVCLAEPFVAPIFGRGNASRPSVFVGEFLAGLLILAWSSVRGSA